MSLKTKFLKMEDSSRLKASEIVDISYSDNGAYSFILITDSNERVWSVYVNNSVGIDKIDELLYYISKSKDTIIDVAKVYNELVLQEILNQDYSSVSSSELNDIENYYSSKLDLATKENIEKRRRTLQKEMIEKNDLLNKEYEEKENREREFNRMFDRRLKALNKKELFKLLKKGE